MLLNGARARARPRKKQKGELEEGLGLVKRSAMRMSECAQYVNAAELGSLYCDQSAAASRDLDVGACGYGWYRGGEEGEEWGCACWDRRAAVPLWTPPPPPPHPRPPPPPLPQRL